jgi:hypothetical protein
VCVGGSNYLLLNYYFPFISLVFLLVCVGCSNFVCITGDMGRGPVTGCWFQRTQRTDLLCPGILCPVHTYEKNIYSTCIYLYRREIKRIQYKDGKKLTATGKLVMDDSQKEKVYYLEMSVRLRRVT